MTERLDQLHQPNFALLLCTLSYLVFGVLYLLLTNDLGSRRSLGLRLLGLALMTAAALAVGWYSHSGLSAILMVVASVVLPWLVPFWIAVAWIVFQHLCLAVVFATFPELNYSITLALLQASIYIGVFGAELTGFRIGARRRLDAGKLGLYLTHRVGRWGLIRVAFPGVTWTFEPGERF